MAAANSAPPGCDQVPSEVSRSDYFLDFQVPAGLMPDPQFDGLPAQLQVHRVQPVYANGKCPGGPTRAAVLIHGRTRTGPVAFDLRHPAPGGGTLSVQEGLARAGIDTFAPSLLGYGHSTHFASGLDDPGNASLRPYEADGTTCLHSEGCDRTHNPVFRLDQQGTLLIPNPLADRRAHTSNVRFARTDVWVRDIRQVIDDAIARAQLTNGKVTLVGYSLGAQHVGRTLYKANPVLPEGAGRPVIAKVDRAVFLSPFFGGPTEETPPPQGFVTFPLAPGPPVGAFGMPPGRDEVCTGHIVDGSGEQLRTQLLEQDPMGSQWGGTVAGQPTGLVRSPTFSSYGWNADVAGQLTPPTLVMQGLDDIPASVPGGAGNAPAIYNALPASMTNKVLVQVGCASHEMLIEGCSQARCTPTSGTPYGGTPGQPWAGPHSTVKAALIEWITSGTFNGAASGRFTVNDSGVASASP